MIRGNFEIHLQDPWHLLSGSSNRLDVDIVLEGSGGRREITRVPYSRNLLSASADVYDLTALVRVLDLRGVSLVNGGCVGKGPRSGESLFSFSPGSSSEGEKRTT